ncbi:suppressor of fused domain protein, partial [Actinomadura adrarensis]
MWRGCTGRRRESGLYRFGCRARLHVRRASALGLIIVDENDGVGITRHEPRYDGFVAAAGQRQEVAEAIDRHVAEHFGPVAFVWHEFVSHLVGVHVHVVGPTAERPYHTLVTTGMSERPMMVPDGQGISPYAELMMCLPADWPLTQAALQDPRTGWPVQVLKQIARLPHEYATWIGEWHSVPNGDGPGEAQQPHQQQGVGDDPGRLDGREHRAVVQVGGRGGGSGQEPDDPARQ